MDNLLSQLSCSFSRSQTIVQGIDQDSALTLGGIKRRCHALGEELSSHQTKLLALHANNSVDWLIIDMACQQAGIGLVPLPTFFSDEQLRHIFDSTPIDGLLCEKPELFERIFGKGIESCHVANGIEARSEWRENIKLDNFTLFRIKPSVSTNIVPPQTGKITFTSGSTGRPKGVCLSNDQLINQAKILAKTLALKKPRHLCLLPLTTLLENIAGMYAPLLAGGKLIIPGLEEIGFEGSSSIKPKQFISIIDRVKPNSIILTPQLLVVLVAATNAGWKPPTSLIFVAVGGSRVSAILLQQARDGGIPAFEGYGLSECASVVSLNTPNTREAGSGKPLSHLKVTMIDNEIIVTGSTMLGYLGEPESRGKKSIATGDTGYLDDTGYLHVRGRKKNLLISSYGRNINPEWVESEMLAHSAFADCIVFGNAKPYCSALVSLRNPDDTDRTVQSLVDTVNSRLPDYARIARWCRLPKPLSAEKGLITDNGRPKREAIFSFYSDLINSLYSGDAEDAAHEVF